MQLTRQTDYALRILMFAVARQRAGKARERFSVEEVSAAYGISQNHVMKIVQRLAAEGYLMSYRGRGGGLVIGKDPARVRIGALIRFLEGDVALAACFIGPEQCRIGGICLLERALYKARDAFFSSLDQWTLDDFALTPRTLAMLETLTGNPVRPPVTPPPGGPVSQS